MRIGAHVPVTGGLGRAVDTAAGLGCETMQIFVSNPRGWATPASPEDDHDEAFRAKAAGAGIGPVFVHAPYLINFASADAATRRRSRALAAFTLARAGAIGAAGVVVHSGGDATATRRVALRRARDAILPLLGDGAGPDLLLEPSAGGAGALAARFDDLGELLAALDDHPRVRVCVDTCHAHAAGYDLSTRAGTRAAVDALLAAVGERVALLHGNDSRDPAGSHRDRHAEIGEGTIGEDAFRVLLRHRGLAHAAMVVETPGGLDGHKRNVARLKRLRDARSSGTVRRN